MSAMTAPVREKRSPNELAIQRAAAGQPVSPNAEAWEKAREQEKARAVVATLDWIEGRTALAPVTGEPIDPDDDAVDLELTRAEDAEQRALRSGVDSTYWGNVGLTLSWLLKEQFTEAPY